jgi:hypothetical protein
MRAISIIAYFFIFLKGWMILIPFGLVLFCGIFEGELLERVLIAAADLALLALVIISFKEKSKITLTIEVISYFLLLLPLIRIFTSFSFDNFNYFLFLFPAICFVILYPLSVLESFRKYQKQKNLSKNVE